MFEDPLSISKSEIPDILIIEFVEPELFLSKETGKALSIDSGIRKNIPKQFPDETQYNIVVTAANAVQTAASTAFLSQIGVTICLAISLKAMWNLMHVMQVMAYLRLLTSHPANSEMMLKSMHNAITLEHLIDEVYTNYLKDLGDSFSAGGVEVQL